MENGDDTKLAYFAAGCFWDVEEHFRQLDGVVDTTVGFMGGSVENPTYKQVCNQDTGHAETTKVLYDPSVVSYMELLEHFWNMHDPTQLNRQGPDVGEQYRSAIFYENEEQKKKVLHSKQTHESEYADEIVTEIVPAKEFYKAEEYHQEYIHKQNA